MGKKKLAVIDDSVESTEEPKKEVRKKVNPNPELLEKEREEARKAARASKALESNESEESKVENVVARSESDEAISEEQVDSGSDVRNDKKAITSDKKSQPKKKASKQEKKAQKVRGKKYTEAKEKVERNKLYSINEATELVKETSYSKFEGTLEIHINTSQKGVRGLVSLPFASGKKLNILAFGKGAEESGADEVGDDDKLKEIEKGKISFDVLVTTPDWMPKLARAAKILGPKGLMPNPKNGTISIDLKKTVTELQGGKVEYKSEAKANVIHLGVGKLSQPADELSQNLKVLLSTIGKTRIKKVTISPTMGPGIKLDLSSI